MSGAFLVLLQDNHETVTPVLPATCSRPVRGRTSAAAEQSHKNPVRYSPRDTWLF